MKEFVVLDKISDTKGWAEFYYLDSVRYCGRCLCFRPVSEFAKRGRTCLQCRDPKKDQPESEG